MSNWLNVVHVRYVLGIKLHDKRTITDNRGRYHRSMTVLLFRQGVAGYQIVSGISVPTSYEEKRATLLSQDVMLLISQHSKLTTRSTKFSGIRRQFQLQLDTYQLFPCGCSY
ncbi:unnamed protein product [Rhizophagus irregularis]|nr:unnamed protein product [Rhizophagus irregularis]CAB5376312.1 unnamed protein product [Rhizophagus irregularis]